MRVQVWNRTPPKADQLAADGAIVAISPAAAAADVNVLITMLTDGAAVEQVMTGPNGALSTLGPDAVWVQMSTVGVEWSDRLAHLAARHGVAFVDAPVSGSSQPAEDGQLLILAAAAASVRPRLEPILQPLARQILWLDRVGDGSRLKLALNNWLAVLVEGMAETLTLADTLGLDPHLFVTTIAGGPWRPGTPPTKPPPCSTPTSPPDFPYSTRRKTPPSPPKPPTTTESNSRSPPHCSTVGIRPSPQATDMTTSPRPSPSPPTPQPTRPYPTRPPPAQAGRGSAASSPATAPGLPPLNDASGEAAVITGYLIADAAHDFTRIRRRQIWSRLIHKLRRRCDQEIDPLDFDDIAGPLRHAGRRNLGLHNLDIDTIVGSVGRVGDFDRWFRPRRPVNRQRWETLDRANRTGAILPPIEVYKVGHLHFVRDGHHRLSIARAHGIRTIDALVTEVATTLPAPPSRSADTAVSRHARGRR